MTCNDFTAIGSCSELAPGDAIEVFYKSSLVHLGPVTEIVPGHGVFWILDTLTGRRCLLELSEIEIVRLPAHYREVAVGVPGQ